MGFARFLTATGLLVGAFSAQPAIAGKAEDEAIARSPADATRYITIANDRLDTSITLSSEPFYLKKDGLLRVVNADQFMRAWIDKKTGKATFQVYIWARYGNNWQNFNRATYTTSDGPVDAEVVNISSDVEGCSAYGCTLREDFGFSVPEDVVRYAAEGAAAGTGERWEYRIYSKSGPPQTTGLLKTEIAGLLRRVDLERSYLRKPSSDPTLDAP